MSHKIVLAIFMSISYIWKNNLILLKFIKERIGCSVLLHIKKVHTSASLDSQLWLVYNNYNITNHWSFHKWQSLDRKIDCSSNCNLKKKKKRKKIGCQTHTSSLEVSMVETKSLPSFSTSLVQITICWRLIVFSYITFIYTWILQNNQI